MPSIVLLVMVESSSTTKNENGGEVEGSQRKVGGKRLMKEVKFTNNDSDDDEEEGNKQICPKWYCGNILNEFNDILLSTNGGVCILETVSTIIIGEKVIQIYSSKCYEKWMLHVPAIKQQEGLG